MISGTECLAERWIQNYNHNLTEESKLICQNTFFDLDLSEIPIARQIVFVVILHSHDCEWVLKWIQKYYDEFKENKQMKIHLEHFLYRRSYWRNDEKIKELVEKILENYK